MKDLEINRYKQRLDNLFEQISAISDNFELKAHWARYLCVLVAGFIETSISVNIHPILKRKSGT